MNDLCWLYRIIFPNGKLYIGLSKTPSRRLTGHIRAASKGRKLPLSQAIQKYGSENIKFEILVCGKTDYIKDLEIAAIQKFKTQDRRFGYNVTHGGDLSPMLTESCRLKYIEYCNLPEQKEKIIARNKSRRGWKMSDSHKEAISKAHKGISKPCPQERRERISKKLTGRKLSEEHCKKLRNVKVTEETRRKLSAVLKGKSRSPETRERMRQAALNRKPYPQSFGEIQSQLKKLWWKRKKLSEKLEGTQNLLVEIEQAKKCIQDTINLFPYAVN